MGIGGHAEGEREAAIDLDPVPAVAGQLVGDELDLPALGVEDGDGVRMVDGLGVLGELEQPGAGDEAGPQVDGFAVGVDGLLGCLLYTSPSPRDS